MAKHHPDLVMCRKQPGVAIGRLCEKCKFPLVLMVMWCVSMERVCLVSFFWWMLSQKNVYPQFLTHCFPSLHSPNKRNYHNCYSHTHTHSCICRRRSLRNLRFLCESPRTCPNLRRMQLWQFAGTVCGMRWNGRDRCLLLSGMRSAGKGSRWVSENSQFGIHQNGSILWEEEIWI